MARTDRDQPRRLPTRDPMPVETVETETEIDLIELVYRLLENTKYILLAAVLCGMLAGIYTFMFQKPQYEATAKLYVMTPGDSAINLSDLQIGTYLTKDYQEVFNTWEVHEMVIKNLGLSYSYKQLQSMLSVTNPKDTRVLHITATSTSAQEAMQLANEYASVAQKYISATMSTEEPNTFSQALLPTAPIGPNKSRTVLLGLILGAFLAAGVITVQFVMDDKIKTADDIAKYTGLSTLAIVPVLYGASEPKQKQRKPAKAASKRK